MQQAADQAKSTFDFLSSQRIGPSEWNEIPGHKRELSSRAPRIAAAAAAAAVSSTATVVFLTLRRPGPLAAARPGRSDCADADAVIFCRSCGVHLSICAQTWAHELGEINNDVNIGYMNTP